MLAAIEPTTFRVAPTVREVALAYIQQRHDVSPEELTCPSRYKHYIAARALFVAIMQAYRPHVSSGALGQWLKRDHSTVLNLARRAEQLLRDDEEFRQDFARFAAFYAAHGGETQ